MGPKSAPKSSAKILNNAAATMPANRQSPISPFLVQGRRALIGRVSPVRTQLFFLSLVAERSGDHR